MWGYQPDFRIHMEYRAKQALAALGANIEVKALLVGVRLPEITKNHFVCIEPEDGEWNIAAFNDVHRRAGEIFTTHPDQHIIVLGDQRSMLDKPEKIRRKSVREAIEEVLSRIDSDRGTRSFCNVPVRLGNFHVAQTQRNIITCGNGNGRSHQIQSYSIGTAKNSLVRCSLCRSSIRIKNLDFTTFIDNSQRMGKPSDVPA